MKKAAFALVLLGAVLRMPAPAAAQSGPTYRVPACKVAPRIDGIDTPGEWAGAFRVRIDVPMASGKLEPRPSRRAELRLMASSTNLYVALRMPDAARDMSASPLVADMAVLAFCRGAEVAKGDDRRIVLPGAWADKHFVAPGKDEDDARRDGAAAMVWRSEPTGGEYFVEWQVPLKSGDPNDIAAAPGDRLAFNIAYIDDFSSDLARAEIGGLFGSDIDHVGLWGALVLPKDAGPEARAPAPEWLARLFPYTGKPNRLQHRLSRVDAGEMDVQGKIGGWATVQFAYPGLDGRDEVGQARIFLPPQVREKPGGKVSLVHNAGYELDDAGAAGLLAKGYAVSTPHANPLNPLGRGVNLDRAILHAVRRLPCVDAGRVSIQGGSAGGWMTLMLAADAFPIVWAMPDVPPIHWGYNAAYIAEHKAMAGPPAGGSQPRLPVLAAVVPIAEQSLACYGEPFDSPAYLAISPLAHLDTITAPTLAVFSTADILVPIDQVSTDLVQPIDRAKFPAGFSTALTDRFPGVNGKRTLLSALPRSRFERFMLPLPEEWRIAPGGQPRPGIRPIALPFSRTKVWSVVVIDEGPVEPGDGHFKFQFGMDHEPFRVWAERRGVTPDQLTRPKLERLMKRMLGQPWRPLRARPGGKGPEIAANQLDYAEAERADVLLGLQTFARDDACATRLARIYAELPAGLKVLGPRLGDGGAAGVRKALAAAAMR